MKKLTFLTAILLATTTFAQIPNYVPTNGLVGWWPFNGNANDESGNGNNGTVNGATLTSDRFGNLDKAFQFNNNSINIPLTQTLVKMSNRTISLWFNSTISQSGGRLFETTNYSWGIACYNSTNIGCWYQKSEQAFNFVDESFQNHNEWYNLVFVCDSSNQQKKLYLNGNLINSGSPVTNPGNPTDYINHYLKIGIGNSNESFTGSIDDIGIWNRALTACEIKDLYNSQLGSTNTSSSQTQTALDTYTWPVNNQTYTQSGTYSDTLVNAAGCDSIVTLNLTLNYTGINELNASQLVVSPNPAKDNFSISGLELLGTITSMEIKDAAGKVVKVLNPTTTNFSCVGLKAGVYFLAVTSNKTEQVIKIIKE